MEFLGLDIGPEVGALLMPGRRRRRRVSLLRGGLCTVSRAVGEGGASLCLGSSVCVLRGWSLFGYLIKGTSQQEFLHVDIAMIPQLVGSFLSFFLVLVRRHLLFNKISRI